MNTQRSDNNLLSTRNSIDLLARWPEENWGDESLLLETDYLAFEDDDQVIDEHIRGLNYAEGY